MIFADVLYRNVARLRAASVCVVVVVVIVHVVVSGCGYIVLCFVTVVVCDVAIVTSLVLLRCSLRWATPVGATIDAELVAGDSATSVLVNLLFGRSQVDQHYRGARCRRLWEEQCGLVAVVRCCCEETVASDARRSMSVSSQDSQERSASSGK